MKPHLMTFICQSIIGHCIQKNETRLLVPKEIIENQIYHEMYDIYYEIKDISLQEITLSGI